MSLGLSIIIVLIFSFGISNITKKLFVNDSNNSVYNVNTSRNNFNKNEDDNLKNSKNNESSKDNKKSNNKSNSDKVKVDNSKKDNTNDNSSTEETDKEFEWYIKIPKIKLYAPIEEGTDEEILNRSIGHFEDTSIQSGNCGLAAHNRGYRVNYFARLKELKEGDIINYFVNGEEYIYKVNQVSIIYETDWSVLEDTEDSKITLITCVENRDEYRLCVQGSLIQN